MVNSVYEGGFRVEDILSELLREASSSRHKGLRDACADAADRLGEASVHPKLDTNHLRETCFLPFKIALESRSVKLASLAITGLQKLLSDERFHTSEEKDSVGVQFLNAVANTPSLSDEVQLEVMKLLMLITSSESCILQGEQLVKISEVCIGTYIRAHQAQTKSSCKATLMQMLTSACRNFHQNTVQKNAIVKRHLAANSQSEDAMLLLKHFCSKLQTTNSAIYHQHALYLESIHVVLCNLSISIQQNTEFVNLTWQVLCPALNQMLGDHQPRNHGNHDDTNQNRRPPTPAVYKTVYSIVAELVRLVGAFSKTRSTLEPMFQRMNHCTHTPLRMEALKVLKDIVGSPQRIFDLAGPTHSMESPEKQNIDTELLRIIMCSIEDSSRHSDSCVSTASVSCAVALLGTLEDLSHGRGLSDEQIETLAKVADWQEVMETSALISGHLSSDEDDEKPDKPKHIRWQMDYDDSISEAEEEGSHMVAKTVTWAQNNEERVIDYSVKGKSKNDQKRSGIPKLKSLNGPKSKQSADQSKSDNKLKTRMNNLKRSLSSFDLKPKSCKNILPSNFRIRRTNSTSQLEVRSRQKYTDTSHVQVDFDFFERQAKRNKKKHARRGENDTPPKPILRRVKSFNENDKTRQDSYEHPTETDVKSPKCVEIAKTPEENISPSKETTINGIPLSKLPRQQKASKNAKKRSVKPKAAAPPPVAKPPVEPVKVEPQKTVEEIEKEGARNFARCLLGILPSVLAAPEPAAADELLQQFASDVCEAVTCMTLKRKNVPNFGNVRTHELDVDASEDKDPSLNADGVYKTVYETLHLSYKLTHAGFFKKKGVTPIVPEADFIGSIIDSGVPVRLSKIWLSEVYRLATTYDILSKAGCKSEESEMSRALVGILSERIYTHHPSRCKDNQLSPVKGDLENLSPARREGTKLSRRLLICTWDQVLNILAVPLDTTTKFVAGDGSVGLALMLDSTGSPKKQLSLERDLVCLTLDGFRRAARLCCTLGIQSRCDMILSRLSETSCSGFFDKRKNTSKSAVKLHAAHVLSMDALLAAGLELGSKAPQAWSHVFRCCMYISNLEHASFSNGESTSPGSQLNGVLSSEDASRAVYALSSAVDHLFDMAATTLPINALNAFLRSLTDASHEQLFGKDNRFSSMDSNDSASVEQQMISLNTLHLYHICDVMLRCTRNNSRPLLHVMEAWTLIANHLVEAAYHRARHVSKVALTSIHDILSEMLKRRNELPHFWFYDALFTPFNTLMSLDTCDTEIQDQILYTLYELVEGFGQSIKSGWRPLLRTLSNVRLRNNTTEELSEGEMQRQKLVFNIIENFVNVKSSSVFASAVVSAVLCLLSFLRGNNEDEDYTEATTTDLCEPSLNIIAHISKKLSSIYIQPSSSIFYGSYSILLVSMAESQDRVWDDNWSGASSDSEHRSINAAGSIVAIDDTGILRVWFLLLEGLTSNIATSPVRYQPHIIELLFEILRSITTVPGPHFSMFVISNLVLPMLTQWVQRGSRAHWENTLPNFKHACGMVTQLVVEEMARFLTVEGAEECVPLMLNQLLELFQECISQPMEAIARTGCSCLRHLLLSAGPQFTEELWHILCRGIKQIFLVTLAPIKELIECFQHGSCSVGGDKGVIVKVVARRDSTPLENMRLMQIAEQVYLLESQLTDASPRSESSLDEDDNRSFTFILSDDHSKPEATATRVTFRALTVCLLCNEILTQMLGSILLESAESICGSILSNITESGLIKRNKEDNSLPGLLCYLSPVNLGTLFDCLTTTYHVAHDYNNRPGLRSLVQKLARFTKTTNLLRQSITSFAIYLNTLFQISRHDGENFSISNIKRILTGEKVYLDVNDSTTSSPSKSASSGDERHTLNEDRYRNLLKGEGNIDWIIKRLFDACNQISSTYQTLHQSEVFVEQDSGFIDSFHSSPQMSPRKQADLSEECVDLSSLQPVAPSKHRASLSFGSPFRKAKKADDVGSEKNYQGYQWRRREDEMLHLCAWSQLIISMLELLLGLPTLQFKSVLPAVFPAVTSLIKTVHEPKVRQLVCDVVRRCGTIYGIV